MNNDIDQMIKKCPSCQELRPSLQKLPMLQEQTFKESRPMKSVSRDLFSHAGKDYLMLVDRYSDYKFCSDGLSKTNTSTILNVLIKWFRLFGYPSGIHFFSSRLLRRLCASCLTDDSSGEASLLVTPLISA